MDVRTTPTLVQSAQSDATRPRIVMLTTGTRHAARVVASLAERGLRLDGVVLERPRGAALLSRIREVHRRRGWRDTLAAIARRLIGAARPTAEPWRAAEFYRRTAEVTIVDSLAGPQSEAALDRLRPDLLILGGAPILPGPILERARAGVLNAHPGLLPRYRGVDVVAHAVLNDDPVGATVHFVDVGIDTGRIVERVEVPVRPGDRLRTLQERVEAAGAVALADAVARFVRDGALTGEAQPHERHPLCRPLSPERRREAEAKLGARR